MPQLCAFGCADSSRVGSGVRMHCFPNPDKNPEKFRAWVYLVGGKLETAADYEYYKKKRVCDIHFKENDKNRNNRLNVLAVPTLHLHGHSTSENVGVPEPTRSVDEVVLSLNIVQSTSENIEVPEPTSSIDEVVLPQNIVQSASENVGLPEPTRRIDEVVLPLLNIGHDSRAISAITVPEPMSNSRREPPLPLDIAGDIPAAIATRDHNYAASKNSRSDKSTISKCKRSLPVYCAENKTLRTKIKNLRSQICCLRKKGNTFKERLRIAQNLSLDKCFNAVVKNMTKPSKLFVHMQLQASKKSKGRRFTLEEKVLSLSLYKRSPKGYALLNKYFTLPSIKAMKRLLSQIKLEPGINNIIFEKIKKTVAQRETSDRICSLIFDEMSLAPQLFYNPQKDGIQGFTTDGNKFADHALVFMIKGIKYNFKQPIAYYFTNSLNRFELKKAITTVIKHAQESGLIIINTVCDQSTVNVGAITELICETKEYYLRRQMEWRNDVFRCNGRTIIPIYDVPHLIKGIRNNLMNKDLKYTVNGEEKIVKWTHFQMVYEVDKSFEELRLLDKITEEHINPEKINKMRVKLATQLLSHSVAVAAEHLTARGDLPLECRQLIDITLLLDNLFDTLNVSSLHVPNGKIYKGAVRRRSPHHQLWQHAKTVLKTVKFIEKKIVAGKVRIIEKTIPSVTNFIKTIEGMEAIWKVLSQKYGFDALLTRNLNQDPIENFFGNVRSYGARNISPNTVAFEGAFKALLLNNYNSPHSNRANCEEDQNECLQTLDFFVTENLQTPDVAEEESIEFNSFVLCSEYEPLSVDHGQRNYVCGWVLSKCLKQIVKTCQQCKKTLIDIDNSNPKNAFIRAKEYNNKGWLCYPSLELDKCFQDLQNIAVSTLKKNVPKKHIKKTIISLSDLLVDYPFKCPNHKDDLKTYFQNITINVILHSWCRSINRILCGKLTYIDDDDETKMAAQLYYNKRKHYKNKK